MKAPHRCARYRNARGEVIDPADQDGIGCPVCWPPDGRLHRLERDVAAGAPGAVERLLERRA